MVLQWNPRYSVRVAEIDEQHKKLILIINELFSKINSPNLKTIVDKLLKELRLYAISHFQTEERYFDKYKFELSAEHKAEHEKFKRKLDEFSTTLKSSVKDRELATEILNYLADWFHQHLVEQDQKYVKCFTEHGLK